ncbi:MAG: amidophosphoribosyltransferase [Sphingobacteriia bacterium 24-36-13]|jgi:amidophosphoribosyltransferase|uniref:amidophosphoribosyltransferase n=1 Tax=Sediminibacterium sp. TaxID=1917865 RepID=UPI000BD33DED|nr:amidophosphoribosyltransferase [Sediminibacterium sp.]OYY10954.1 MAG: amidophosphoribosyltransferase [Sphingobacteriia bacterium 35-36-14]OYZ53696.1 MAG: amidophosphoribosyltransferase [Sphingobacteriia bacterium 24-36-13]OZA64805.1 MAG: amidophosphoribosyltransferase [Sphingobacteriia bacterium 39-36-14]HQS24833.1 amidophosphoribosyltransferase [Sediminibacterium sp.]HQS35446.1 amidophosphoribosyltransferase [Sediminibacterium sp.]
MSDEIKHECGLAYIRLRKPFSYYLQKHGTVTYGLNKLYLLMEKQHNRGQDGAGLAMVKLNIEPGNPYLHRMRSNAPQPIADLFFKIGQEIQELEKYQPDIKQHPGLMKGHLPFLGELLLGHLRYGTQGKNNVEFCHPFIKRDLMPGKNLALAGNFNLVNTDELFEQIGVNPGDFQKQSDLAAMMEVVHHYLVKEDEANPNNANITNVLKNATPIFDGGYTIGGLLGNGHSFIMRDAHGIRPAYYYINDEVIVAASERAAIRTTFNVGENEVQELMPGTALIVDDLGNYRIEKILEPKERRACSFERIYFSRGSDEKIYRERIALGHHLSETVLERIAYDLKNTIFSYIPNTAEVAFYGLVKGMEEYLNKIKVERILSWGNDFTPDKLEEMVNRKIRQEKIAIKDVKLRTFITEDANRNEMVQHVYDITYGTVRNNEDTLVVIDDSIVRGTTLKESIIRMLSRLSPKKIIVVSSAPQIRYPDCYGIDMSKLGDFIAFRAAIALLKERNMEDVLDQVRDQIIALENSNELHTENVVRQIYKPFTTLEISDKIAQLITPEGVKVPVEVIYQTIEDLHECCPTNTGDWYFTGNYPTPGGNKVVNKAFLNYLSGKNVRGY